MFKRILGSNMQRLFLCIVVLCILGILLMGVYSCYVLSSSLFEQAEKTTLMQMQLANEQMDKLVNSIEEVAEKVEECSPDLNDETFARALNAECIGAGFLKTVDGRKFTYNPDGVYVDMIWLQMLCNVNTLEDVSLKWYNGDNENNVHRFENHLIVCASIPQEDKTFSTLYLFVRKSILNEVLNCMKSEKNVVLIMDSGKVLSVSDKTHFKEITNTSFEMLLKIYERDVGFFKFQEYNNNYIIAHYQPAEGKFKFLAIYENYDFYHGGYRIIIVTILIVIILSLFIMIVYRNIRQKYINPINQLVDKMSETDYDTLDEYMDYDMNNEIGILVRQYNDMRNKIRLMVDDICKKEEMKRKAEIAAMRYQINPHFFYNTLSNIKFLAISKGQPEISTIISKFAKLYQYLFSNKENFVKVKDELEFIRNYISIMNARYNNRIRDYYQADEELEECKLPVFILQPIVENAIVHGLLKKLNCNVDCDLRISIGRQDGMLTIEVYDDGSGMPDDKIQRILSMMQSEVQEFGLGLYNTIARLKHQYEDKYRFYIDSVEEQYTRIIIKIPLEIA